MIQIATTGIWKIDQRLVNVIDYVDADFKSEKQCYVSVINYTSETALEEIFPIYDLKIISVNDKVDSFKNLINEVIQKIHLKNENIFKSK